MSYASDHAVGIGCGELAAMLGLDPRQSQLELWAVKRGLVVPDDGGDATTQRGVEEEEGCIAWAERRLGVTLGRQGRDYRVPMVRGHLLGSPDAADLDGLCAVTLGLEGKTRQYSIGWGPDGSSEIPLVERIQVEGYLALTGAPRWYVSVLFGLPLERRLYRIDRDPRRCDALLGQVEAWWELHVVQGEPPDARPEELSARARLLHPATNGAVLRADAPEVVAAMEARRDAERVRKAAQTTLAAAELRWRETGGVIEGILGDAERLVTPIGVASLRSRGPRGRLVTKWNGEENDDDE